MNDAKITALFKTRDNAIKTRNEKLFLSTQVGELTNSNYGGYIKIDKMKTDILSIYSEKDKPYNKVVFAKETYYPTDNNNHSWFMLYFLIDTKEGWKIYRIAY